MPSYSISEQDLDTIFEYLAKQPFGEVWKIMAALQLVVQKGPVLVKEENDQQQNPTVTPSDAVASPDAIGGKPPAQASSQTA